MSTRVGERWGQGRRDRVAYLTMLRRSGSSNRRATAVRGTAAVVVLVLAAGSGHVLAVGLCGPALLVAALQLLQAWREATGSQSRVRLLRALRRNTRRTNGRHVIAVDTHVEIVAGLLLVAVASWAVPDASPAVRLSMLVVAAVHVASTAVALFTDQAWFNPEEVDRPVWHEVVRRLAAPVTAGLVAVVALPAAWPAELWPAVVVVCSALLLVELPIRDVDLIVARVAPLVREESHAGRELVISETHGALSTHLRLLEQEARSVRGSAPTLYELAVSANARLRETMTLARLGQETSGSPASLAAPVQTLARAVGAEVSIDIAVEQLDDADRELARMVLNDLVGNAVNAGAGVIGVSMSHRAAGLVVEVEDDALPMPESVWKSPGTSSARLESRLAARSGSLTVEERAGGKRVRACWAPHGLERGAAG